MVKSVFAVAALAVVAQAAPSINVYWGQKGSNRLRTYCDSTGFEYITVSFVTSTPEKDPAGAGYPGTNFGSHCNADVYSANGKKTRLLSKCDQISADIPYCQARGKKVLLSIGGDHSKPDVSYGLKDKAEGTKFANFLWGAFGPNKTSYVRPFDSAGKITNNQVSLLPRSRRPK